tara:strand:- start:69 stop:710 length:642 start_codon:yes stop_codon:yes gene_type:complete
MANLGVQAGSGLDASDITTGTFSTSVIPNLAGDKITSGTLSTTVQDNITRLGTVTSGTFNGAIGTSATGVTKIEGFSAYGATESITAGSGTYFTGSGTAFSNHFNTATFSSGRFTADLAGYYLVSVTAQCPLQDDGQNFQLSIQRNRSSSYSDFFARQIVYSSTTNANLGNSISSLVYLDGGTDYIELYMYLSDDTATVTVQQFSAFLVGVTP